MTTYYCSHLDKRRQQKQALKETQDALIPLKKLLQIAAGDLLLEKCVFSFMGWSLKRVEETLGSIQDFPVNIQVQDTNTENPINVNNIEA